MSRVVRLRWDDLAGACVAQWRRIADAVDVLPDQAFDIVTPLPGWRLQDLVAHLCRSAGAVATRLDRPAPAKAERDAAAYLLSARAEAAGIDARTRAAARGTAPADLRRALRAAVEDLAEALAGAAPDRVIETRFGASRLDDFVVTRCVEGVVHGLDLDPPVEPEPRALKIAARALLAALALRAPGKAIEVRVPLVAAVQCVAGPRHTRGTPPGVVETDPVTWVRLAAGRIAWTDAVADGRLRASGERSDLSGLLPLL